MSIGTGKLIFENEQAFAISDDGALASLPDGVKIPLDRLLLEEQTDASPDFKTYLYRATAHIAG